MAHRLPAALLRRTHFPPSHSRAFHSSTLRSASHQSAPTTAEGWSSVLTDSRPALSVGGTVTLLLTAAGLGFAYLGQAEKVAERSKNVPKRIYVEINPLITGDPRTVPRSVVKKVEEADVNATAISKETGKTPSPLRIDSRDLSSSSSSGASDDDDDDSSLSSLVGSAIDALSDTLSLSSSSSEAEEPQGAYNPETGEINWGCPCLGGMAFGPCGEEFKAAFSCFVFSEDEPKGMGCLEQFQGMQDCFKRYPEHYKEELEDDVRAEEEARRREEGAEREHREADAKKADGERS